MNKRTSLATAAAVALLGLASAGQASADTLTISCGSVGPDFEFCKKASDDWSKQTGHIVKLFTAPQSTTDQLALLRQMFAAKTADLDVVTIDVVWPGVLADHLIDLKPFSKGAESQHFPAIVANNTLGGKLLAMPWFTDAGLLYYRKDLLEKYALKPPSTWAEMADVAQKVQDGERKAGNAGMQGFVFQAKAYEGLSCNALEWVGSFGGGNVVDADGKISVNNPGAIAALDTAKSWIGTIAPKGVLNYGEEDARGVFQNGNAVFMRNWPYAWAPAQSKDSKIAGKVGVSPLPSATADGKRAATLGGWNLAVTKYSKNQALAAEFVMYLSGPAVQKERAIKGSYNPTMPELYKDKDVLAANPFFGTLYDVFTSAVPRPSTATGAKYPEVSNAFWNASYDVLSGKKSGKDSMGDLEKKLKQVRRSDKW